MRTLLNHTEFDPLSMSNASLIIAAHVARFPDATPENFGALADDAAVAIMAVNRLVDTYRAEVARRLRDGILGEWEYSAILERLADARRNSDPELRRLGAVAV